MIGDAPICLRCKHYNRRDHTKLSCKAYPNGIPKVILRSEINHRKPYKGDHGIQFEVALEMVK